MAAGTPRGNGIPETGNAGRNRASRSLFAHTEEQYTFRGLPVER